MEGAPNITEFTPEEDEKSDRKKTKRASREALAARPVEAPKDEDTEASPGRSGLVRRFLGGEAESKPESKEEETSPLESLSPEEEYLVVRELAHADQVDEANQQVPENAEEAAATEAVDHFYTMILEEQESPSRAFVETMESLGVEQPADEVSEASEEPTDSVEPVFWTSRADNEEGVVELHPPSLPKREPEAVTASHTEQPEDVAIADERPAKGNNSPAVTPARSRMFEARRDAVTGLPWPEVNMDRQDRSDVTGGALIGGMVSYLVGRRRGRIKAEKRLIPIQKKLEKQVKGLRQDLKQKESIIRQTASERARQQLADAYPGRSPVGMTRERLTSAAPVDERRLDRETPATQQQPEKKQIGKFLITAIEAAPPIVATTVAHESYQRPQRKVAEAAPLERRSEESAKEASMERAPAVPIEKHVETLSRQDLLELSSKIIIESTSLRDAYESHQIGEKALRRIVSEHLRGGDVREALRNEIVQHEIDFERDPILRDRALQSAGGSAGGGKALDTLLQRADATIGRQESETLAVLKAREAHQLKERANQEHQRQVVTTTLVSTIVLLAGIVMMLLLTR